MEIIAIPLFLVVLVIIVRYRFRIELNISNEQTKKEICIGLILFAIIVMIAHSISGNNTFDNKRPTYITQSENMPRNIKQCRTQRKPAKKESLIIYIPYSDCDKPLALDEQNIHKDSAQNFIFNDAFMNKSNKYILSTAFNDITNNLSLSKRNAIFDDDNFSLENSFGTIRENSYGLGVHSDQFGRPVRYEVPNWPKNEPTYFLKVKPDVYGPGIGQDQFGRPVKTTPIW